MDIERFYIVSSLHAQQGSCMDHTIACTTPSGSCWLWSYLRRVWITERGVVTERRFQLTILLGRSLSQFVRVLPEHTGVL